MIAVDRQRVGYEDTSHSAQALYRELCIVSDEIMELRRAIVDADEHARTYHFRISDVGALVDDGGELGPDQADTRAAAADRLRGDIKRIVESAEKVDAELAATLERADQPLVRLDSKGNQVDRLDIPKNASPQEIADWWKGLSEEEQDELIKTNASFVGNTDGVSVEDRDKANRILLDEKRGYLESERDRVQAELRKTGGPGGQGRRMQLEAELETINGKLSGIKTIESRLAAGDAASDETDKYYLMQIQHSGDGQAIVARGNPDTADNVTTYIPGTGSELSKIEGDLNRSDKMQDSAHWSDPSQETAVITYLGYDAPDGLSNATQQSYAHDAKKDPDSFQDGIRASHDGTPSNNTVLGHATAVSLSPSAPMTKASRSITRSWLLHPAVSMTRRATLASTTCTSPLRTKIQSTISPSTAQVPTTPITVRTCSSRVHRSPVTPTCSTPRPIANIGMTVTLPLTTWVISSLVTLTILRARDRM